MAVKGFFDEDVEDVEDDLEDEDTELEFEDSEDKEDEPKPRGKKVASKEKEENDDEDIEIVEDVRGWDKDPAADIEDPNDAQYKGRIKKRINKLTAGNRELARQRDEETKKSAQLEAYAKRIVAEKAILEAQLNDRAVSQYETAAAGAKAGVAAAQSRYRQALSAGDAEGAVEAQTALAEAMSKAGAFEEKATVAKTHKSRLDSNANKLAKEANDAATAVKSVGTTEASDVPLDRIKWFKKNPWCNIQQPDEMTRYALYAAGEAESELGEADTPEYFELVDKAMRRRYPKFFGVASKSTTVRTERVSRDQRANSGAKNKLTLTKSQLATAHRLGIKGDRQLKVYALECRAAEKRSSGSK